MGGNKILRPFKKKPFLLFYSKYTKPTKKKYFQQQTVRHQKIKQLEESRKVQV